MSQKTPTPLATPHDLNEKGRQEITIALNGLVADAFALYVKSKNFHWHLSGPHFRDYHLLFDEQADQILAMIDPLAERARKLGGTTIRSVSQIGRLKSIPDDEADFREPETMLEILRDDNKTYAAQLRTAHQICEKHGDVASCSLLEVFIDETERRVWFLFELNPHSDSH